MSKISVAETIHKIEWEINNKEVSALTSVLYKVFAQAYGNTEALELKPDEQAILQSLLNCAEGINKNT